MTKTNQPQGRHFGPAPKTAPVLAEIRRAHRLGFKTVLLSEYRNLEAQAIHPEVYDFLVAETDLKDLKL